MLRDVVGWSLPGHALQLIGMLALQGVTNV